jgi:hypothetical protein
VEGDPVALQGNQYNQREEEESCVSLCRTRLDEGALEIDHYWEFGTEEKRNAPFLSFAAHFEVLNVQEQVVESPFLCLMDSQVHLGVC